MLYIVANRNPAGQQIQFGAKLIMARAAMTCGKTLMLPVSLVGCECTGVVILRRRAQLQGGPGAIPSRHSCF